MKAKKTLKLVLVHIKRANGIATTAYHPLTGTKLWTSWSRSGKITKSETPMPAVKQPVVPIKEKKPIDSKDNVMAFKRKVIELVNNGTKALEALTKAAKEYGIEMTAGMKNYPASFIFNYKKAIG